MIIVPYTVFDYNSVDTTEDLVMVEKLMAKVS
jgi:hypothetical protein